MIVHDDNVFGPIGRPPKTQAPLPIDPNAMLTDAVALQTFELVPGRRAQIRKPRRRVEHVQLARSHRLDRPPPGRTNPVPKEASVDRNSTSVPIKIV
jgi:hypothetical protein